MKNIYQLAKLNRRAAQRARGSMKALTKKPSANPDAKPWKNNAGVNVNFHRARLQVCAIAMSAVKKDCLDRRIGLPGIRDARPLRIQKLSPLVTA